MAPHGLFPAAGPDAWLTLAVRSEREWEALTTFASNEAWAHDPGFSDVASRLAHVDALDRAVGAWTRRHERDALVDRLRSAGIPASPVLSIDEMWCDPHLAARGLQHRVDLPFYGAEALFRGPWLFSDCAPEISRSGPTTGEHNERVFGEILGLSASERAELEAAGALG